MVDKASKKNLKIIAILSIIIVIIGLLVGKIYSTNDNHYVLVVDKEQAISKDNKVQITEKIVKGDNESYFNSKELDYEVELKNISKAENIETQVAIVVDTSYSMQTNDTNNVVKNKAIELANGILTNVDKSRVSISNNKGIKVNMTNYGTEQTTAANKNNITNQINALITGDGNDSNTGLENAKNSFTTPQVANDIVKKYIIVFTDSTDDVSTKMQNIATNDINIISVLVDMTSSSYVVNNQPVCGKVYLLLSELNENEINSDIELLDLQKIYEDMNKSVNKITVNNEFSEEILKYFDIQYKENESNGTITTNNKGYTWNVETLKGQHTAKLKFKLKLKTNIDINAGIIFEKICTNKIQDIEYEGCTETLKGTDSREGTESTVIRICQGYDLKIKAVNEANKDLAVEGIEFKVVGINDAGEEVCNLTKTTGSDGYITITADEAKAFRVDGTITFTATPNVNQKGYSKTDSVTFIINSNKETKLINYVDNGSNIIPECDSNKRLVKVTIPINSQKLDFELKAQELNNSNVSLGGCKFELIQPKLNNQYEMNILTGETDETGTIHFSPTVMTKPGKYNYILRQIPTDNGYEATDLTLITIQFESDGTIKVDPEIQFNPNVKGERIADDHVLITVGNENLKKDPFDLEINLQDKTDGTKLEGVTYLVKTITSNNVPRSEYIKTDKDGKINAKIYGNGLLTIEITEQAPKVGYAADTTTKEISINRVDGVVHILHSNINKNDLDQNSNRDNVIVNLYSQKKAEQNIVRISLVDADEQDIPVGEGVVYYLKDEETGKEYGPIGSDRKGQIAFTIEQKQQGQHRYKLFVDSNSIPNEYNQNSAISDIYFNLNFNEGQYINDIDVTDSGNVNVLKEYASTVNNENSVEYTAFIEIGYQLDVSNTAEFTIQLFDKDEVDNKGNFIKAIQGAQYKVNIEWDINVNGEIVTRTKTIEGRKTNGNGQIVTRIVRADDIRIYVTQIGAAAGYNMDLTTQEIYVKCRNNGTIAIESQTPYDMGNSNTDEPNQGAYVNGGSIIYQHLNRKKTAEDTYVNLTINKIDMNGAYVDGVILNIKSNTLVDKDNAKLDLIMKTGDQGSQGTVTIDYAQYLKDMIKNNLIRVPGIGETAEEIVYDMQITEMELDTNSPTGYSEKSGTTVKLRLIFRYKDDKVTLTNVETIFGNRLVKQKIFSSASDTAEGQQEEEAMGVYLSNITLDLYTNYDDIGNLSIDFKKQDQNGEELEGAIYDLKITNPDSTVIRKNGIKIRNGQDSSDIEISGLNVNVGSIIELTETKAPIGHEININTEILEVVEINDDGEITLEEKETAYSPKRIKLEPMQPTMTTAGTLKTNYQITFIDYQLDTFEFEITAKDTDTKNGVGGFGFRIDTNKGATGSLTTGSDGIGKTRVGGNIQDNTITYTVSLNKVADYYKPLNSLIKVNVVFNEFGQIDVDKTRNAQQDPNYGTLWNIITLNATDRGPIGIEVFVEHQDPLVVKVQTIDKITNNQIANVSYKIEKSEVLAAEGRDTIEVGYALENGVRNYTLIQKSIANSYRPEANKTFTVTYKNEIIDTDPTKTYLTSTTPEDSLKVTGNKEITIKIYVEPKVPFEITNLYYFDNNTKLQGANFEVISQRNQDKGTGTTDANGMTSIYSDIFGTNDGEQVIYKIRQTKAALGYATVEDFYVKVTYNSNREITSAILTDQSGTQVTNNRFVTIGVITTSTYSQYNSNNKGIVTIQVLNYPEFKIEIENVDRRDGTTPIAGTTYSVKSTYVESDNSIVNFTQTTDPAVTNANGIGIAHLDKTRDNTVVKYTVKEDKPATNYQSLGTDINVIVTFDGDGFVSNVEVENDNNLSKIEHASKIDPINDPRDNFIVKLQLKNNPILKFNITKVDSENHESKINGIGFTMVSKKDNKVYSNSSSTNRVNQKEIPEMSALTGSLGTDGYTELFLDRTIDNSDMYYTIQEVQKAPGYEWAGQDIILKISYDQDGKISSKPVAEQGREQVTVKNFNEANFEIDLEIYNTEIKEFGIHLTAVDAYNKEKKINDLKVEAFLVQQGDPSYQTPDADYNLMGNRALLTGEDKNNDGSPDITYGEDYKAMGAYTRGAGTRYLRLIIKNESDGTGESTNGTYYKRNSNSKTLGYYKGNEFVEDAYYQTVVYDYLIRVDFNDDGQITDSQLVVGNNINGLGITVDSQYIETKDGNNDYTINSFDKYKLNITMKLFPLLRLSLNGMDNYTYEDEIKANENKMPNKLTGTKYTVSTQRHTSGPTTRDEYITAGYRGIGHYLGIHEGRVYGDIYESKKDVLYAPIENAPKGKTSKRLYFVFEDTEPTNYQKYTPRHFTGAYYNKLVAVISIEFDEYGEFKIDSKDFITRSKYSNIVLAAGSTVDSINKDNGNLQPLILGNDTEVSIISIDGSIVEGTLIDGTRIRFELPAGVQLTNMVYEPNQGEFGNYLSDCDNLKAYKYWYAHNPAKRSLEFYIGYALTTTINVTAIDDISGKPISNIRMTPLLGTTYTTNTSYEYETKSYRDTDTNGEFNIKYWGAAETNSKNQYIIGSNRQGNDYNGYLFPSDMASATLNGSGNAADYFAKIDVTYDKKGKISSIEHLGHDLWGDKNSTDDFTRTKTFTMPSGQIITYKQNVNISYDKKTGNIYIKMLYSRKFQMSLNKIDYYDNTINKLNASFSVTSDKGLKTTINSKRISDVSKELTPMGKVYKDTTVKYTLAETKVPDGYYPIKDTIDYYVTFDKNGNIGKNSIKSNSEYFEVLNTSQTTEEKNKTAPDLTINIKNKPAFVLNLKVIDKFYKDNGISNIYLDITNSKGDKALGNPQTDNNGYTNVITGPVYPGEYVTYEIRQTNSKDPDYYPNTTVIQLKVHFNDIGKIDDYTIISGNEVINNFNTAAYMNSRQISMQIMNMPKALKIGLQKHDKTTKEVMPDVPFTITKENTTTGEKLQTRIQTNTNGAVVEIIDTFSTSANGRVIKYTIHEEETPASYRTMEDIVLLVYYNADGSIARYNQIDNDNGILNTDAITQVAIGKTKELNDEKVHMITYIPNDNAYDVIIKNEDTNYAGLGIQGSQFDVSINGQTYTPALTDTNGKTILKDLKQNGDITINIAQRSAGEGYRDDIDNKVEIKLVKGVDIYSIDLKSTTDGYKDDKNATTTKAIVVVDEKYGTITVTFKNETKTELTILKQDINDKHVLENVEFEVIKQQVDNTGNAIGNAVTITDPQNKVTNKDGRLYFDIGVAPQSQIWTYTFKEITPPEGYNPIADLIMTVTYDQYGKISSQVTNERSRLLVTTEHPDNNNCRSMYAIISNGDKSPAYTVKVVTEDIDTGKRINGSSIYMNITDSNGDLIKVEPLTKGSSKNGQTDVTGNLGTNWNKYTDVEVNDPKISTPIIIERGLTYIDNIDHQGIINIEVSQKQTAPGYIFDTQTKTDANIKIEATYIPQLNGNPTLHLEIKDNDGLGDNVRVDDINKTITIVLKNKSEVLFDIVTMQYQSNPEAKPIYIPVNYDITAEIQTLINTEPTDVNTTTYIEASDYRAIGKVGKAYAGKTVVYTLKQHAPLGYKPIDDIKVEIQYDSQGYIKYYEMLSSEDNAYIDVKRTGGRTISLIVINRKQIGGYRVDVEKHAMDTDDDENAYGRLLPGAKFRITVKQSYNDIEVKTWEDTTDENGLIKGFTFNGFGYIYVTIEELDAPAGYILDSIKHFTFYRDPDTGDFTKVDGDVNMDDIFTTDAEGNTIITLKPIDEQANNKFTLVINKISNETNKYITKNKAEFSAELTREDENGNIIYKEPINNIITNEKGKATIDNLDMPGEEGIYKLVITELKAPEGYIGLSDPIEIPIRFVKNSKGNMVIDSIDKTAIKDLENVSTSAVKPQLIGINIGNDVDEKIEDDEYSLDITKVDAETGKPIENMAIFKVWLPDNKNTAVYTETMETKLGVGKLDYCYIEQDKDYRVRLTHMKLPKEEGTLKYVFREVVAPEGYAIIEKDIELYIEFKKDQTTGELYIASAKAGKDDTDYLRVNTTTPCPTKQRLSVDILNKSAEQNEFIVKYDANDNKEGTQVPADQIKYRDKTLELSSKEPTRKGYIFKGWGTLPTSKTPDFKPGDNYTLNQDMTLYAIWEEKLYLKSTEYLIGTGDNPASIWKPGDLSEYEDGDLYIKGIRPQAYQRESMAKTKGTKLEEFIKNLQTNADPKDVKVYIPEIDAKGEKILKEENVISDTQRLIATGMVLRVTKGAQEIKVTLIVRGDLIEVNSTVGNGYLDLQDISRARDYNPRRNPNLNDEEVQAFDFCINTDLSYLQQKTAINYSYSNKTVETIEDSRKPR